MSRLTRIFLFMLLCLPSAAAAVTSPAGIPTGGIWFSKEPFYVGDQITVNSLVFNASTVVVRGSLELLDGPTILQQKDVVLNPGDSKIISFPLQVTRGKHAYQIRVANGDFTDQGGLPVVLGSSGDYVDHTLALERTAMVTPVQAVPTGEDVSQSSTSTFAINAADPITAKDAQGVASAVEKVIPPSIVQPVVNAAVPVIGATESFRVGEANANAKRIGVTIGDLASELGTAKVLGASTEATSSKKGIISAVMEKISAWGVFRRGLTTGNFIQSPFGYVKLFFFLLYHALISSAWVFYGVAAAALIKALFYVKNLIFPKPV